MSGFLLRLYIAGKSATLQRAERNVPELRRSIDPAYQIEIVDVLTRREGRQHVIVTGRDAAPELVAAADLVMATTKIKHPMDAGQKGQKGIEW